MARAGIEPDIAPEKWRADHPVLIDQLDRR
jgi:hypothetical protein